MLTLTLISRDNYSLNLFTHPFMWRGHSHNNQWWGCKIGGLNTEGVQRLASQLRPKFQETGIDNKAGKGAYCIAGRGGQIIPSWTPKALPECSFGEESEALNSRQLTLCVVAFVGSGLWVTIAISCFATVITFRICETETLHMQSQGNKNVT